MYPYDDMDDDEESHYKAHLGNAQYHFTKITFP